MNPTLKKTLFVLLQHLLPQHLLSRLVGRLAECRTPWIKNRLIDGFRRYYDVDMSEALQPDPAATRTSTPFSPAP